MNNKYLISIVGPTAIGKTALSIKLAKYYNTEIISCDSRQFFKEMTIGTAVPEPDELVATQHHFIQNISITENYSVGTFEREAINKLNELFIKHDTVIMVGGSGLYVNAVINGLDDFPKIDTSIRENLTQRLEKEGIESLQKQLKELDPVSYEKIAIDNPQRLSRALEICIGSGKPYSSFLNKKDSKRNFTPISIGLTADRALMYNRINQRVDIMMEKGLLNEVKSLYKYKTLNALNTVGYKELFKFLDGEWNLDFAVSEIKKNTRRFSKRQITWFKRDESTKWFDYLYNLNDIIEYINNKRGH
ncbi:tRNA (adenosine(37)-N6)-dimethylallyltransferase MiaA [Pseudofulvibacter geojedonensis]|uniref:tRNA dimethylallyltransferase n=1 Tax=Pseudofulvibacter geojedonensis TaxID=1123758 RepID=A0ABW3HYV0_9FLAO